MNRYQTEYSKEYLESLPKEVQEQYYDFITNVPYIRTLMSDDRKYARDLPRDKEGKIIVDITQPHILEDTDYFRPSAIHYQKYGCFTKVKPNANPNSEYGKWLREEVRRCWEGYIRPSDGEWITGDMYFFLNYCPIQLIKKDAKGKTIRTIDFPKFWDGHYYKFHYLNQCRIAGHHAAELASRGKGKSYTAAAMLAKRFVLGESKEVNKKVQCVATASERKYIQGANQLLDMFQYYIDFCANNTEFPRQRITSSLQNLTWTMGYIDSETGTRRGTENSIIGITSKDDESKLRGSRGVLYLLEESGCHLRGTECYKADRTIEKVENIKVGDSLLGPDMQPREVLKTFSGITDMYKITLSNGDTQIVTANHPVYVKVRYWGKSVKEVFKTFTCEELLKRDYKRNYYIMKFPVEVSKNIKAINKKNWSEYSFTIEPYGKGEFHGFLLDKDHLFLLKDNTVVHNTFPRLLNLYQVLRPSVEDGNSVWGLIYLYGTAGDSDSDFSSMQELMYNPEGYNIQSVVNIYDKEGQGRKKFTYFFPGYINRADCYDEDGNSDVNKALLEILLDRYKVKYNSTDINAITKRIAEIPVTPQEAILKTKDNIFPISELTKRLNDIDNNPNFFDDVYVGDLAFNKSGKVEFNPTTTDIPIRDFPTKDNKVTGAIEIYEMPQETHSKIPNDRYIASLDNYENDQAQSMSLGSMFVLDLWTDRIVAEYTGRPMFVDDLNEICRKMCLFYNAKVMVENNKKSTFAYFSKMNSLHLMADTPEYLKNKQILKANTFGNASKGCPATVPVINFAMERLRDWLLKPVTVTEDVKGEILSTTIPNLHFLKNRALIKELMLYNPAINVDRIKSMCQMMLYREEKMILYQGDPKRAERRVDYKYLGNDKFFADNYKEIKQ